MTAVPRTMPRRRLLPSVWLVATAFSSFSLSVVQNCNEVQLLQQRNCFCAGNPHFLAVDSNYDNAITPVELAANLATHTCTGPPAECGASFSRIDTDASGAISFAEFSSSAGYYLEVLTSQTPAELEVNYTYGYTVCQTCALGW